MTPIIQKIETDAKAWAEEQEALAREEADSILQTYREQAEAEARSVAEEAAAKAVAIMERAKSQAEMDRRKLMLGARQESVNRSFERALEMLCSLPEEERVLLMVRSAIRYQTKDAELIFNAADQDVIGPLVVETISAIYTRQKLRDTFSGTFLEQVKKLTQGGAKKLGVSLSEKVGDFAGGFILKQGAIESNCTFEVLVGQVREELERETSSILFAQS